MTEREVDDYSLQAGCSWIYAVEEMDEGSSSRLGLCDLRGKEETTRNVERMEYCGKTGWQARMDAGCCAYLTQRLGVQ